MLDNTVYKYELLDTAGYVNGYICISAMERHKCGRSPLEFFTICRSTGYNGPELPRHLIPTKEVKDSESGKTSIKEMEPYEYPVTDIILVSWTNDVAEQVAIGHVVGQGIFGRQEWVLLA
jgi:hypothetical protein